MPTNQSPAIGGGEAVVYMSRASIKRDEDALEKLTEKIKAKQAELREVGNGRPDDTTRLIVQEELDSLLMQQRDLEYTLSRAEVPCGSTERAEVGSKVTFVLIRTGKRLTLTLVSSKGDINKDKTISKDSPVGKALLGSTAGDTVTALLGSGVEEQIEVIDICVEEE